MSKMIYICLVKVSAHDYSAPFRLITILIYIHYRMILSVLVFDEARIRELFDVHGKVAGVTFPMRHGFGSVTFANRTDANAAILKLNGHELIVPRSYGGNESYGTISVSESKFQSSSDGLLATIENKSLFTIFNFCRMFPDDVANGFRASDAIHSHQAKKRRASGNVHCPIEL